MTRWAYHVTAKRALPRIGRDGLTPSKVDGLLFFTDARHVDDVYGDVVLRFPWPSDAWRVEAGDNLVDHSIDARSIEVRTDAGWVRVDGLERTRSTHEHPARPYPHPIARKHRR